MRLKNIFIIAFLFLIGSSSYSAGNSVAIEEAIDYFGKLPIQASGRVKPIEAFARELVLGVTGKHSWRGDNPVVTMLNWISDPEAAFNAPLINMPYIPLREALGIPDEKSHLSMQELMNNSDFRVMAEEGYRLQQSGGKPTTVQGRALKVIESVGILQKIITIESLNIVPPINSESEVWRNLNTTIADSNRALISLNIVYTGLIESWKEKNDEIFPISVKLLHEELDAMRPVELKRSRLNAEVFYLKYDPLNMAKWIYVLVIVIAVFASILSWDNGKKLTLTLLVLGFFVHTGAMGLRWWISSRAPWTNMYESINTAAWGAILFSLTPYYAGQLRKVAIPAAALVGFISLLITNHVSLNPAISPLVPALQSIWLNIHVIIILLGYSAGAFAMVLAHVWLINDLVKPTNKAGLMRIHQGLYKMVQFAVLFLVVGIALGSIWAHSAWGRFWGWDPKETWALITWFFYLGMIHAGHTGWLKQRGMAIASVLAFLLVLITYYGVNYFLVGLHSYADGDAVKVPNSMIAFFALEIAFVLAYWWFVKKRDSLLMIAKRGK